MMKQKLFFMRGEKKCFLNGEIYNDVYESDYYVKRQETGRVNIRGSWEYQPLSFIYLVFNDTQTDLLDARFAQQQFISKVTFVKQF